ncbi:hypothetical protein ABIA33_003101 [Streptacidiphilus sp. MAP12-16]|uniref:DUF6643 family protein n=1 Tax=Streptacidiphilus sp. MAP12-16 TaxID=3156300 RepID=UPI0035186F88
MTSPRAYDGVGYYAPSFASDTPIYDSLVAERGVPQIAPINVPAALPPAYDSNFRYDGGGGYGYGSAYGSGAPALPVQRLALGPGPSSPGYGMPSQPQYAPPPYIPQQAGPGQRYPEQYGTPPQPNPMYQRPVAPVAPLRPVQYQEQYPPQQRGGYQGY